MVEPVVSPHSNIINKINNEIEKRLEWVKLYESVSNAGIVFLRCGITRPTA
jgi:hypothetical protein